MDQDLDKTKQAPGEARCPGPSTAEIIAKDPGGAPPTFLEESYSFIGDEDISFDHYTSNKYFIIICKFTGVRLFSYVQGEPRNRKSSSQKR